MGSAADSLIRAARSTQERAATHPRWVDAAFSCLIAVLAVADLMSGESVAGHRDADAIGIALVLAGASVLFWRRSRPLVVLASAYTLMTIFYVRDYESFMSAVGLAAVYSATAHEPNRRLAWTFVTLSSAAMVATAGLTVLDRDDGFRYSNGFSMVLFLTVAAGVGALVRNRNEIFVDTHQRAERAEADRAESAERAVARERLRIAREMHDVVAHGMSVIAVQAAAAQEVARTDPERAVRLMHSVETTGRQSLDEMRRMLGVLRNGDDRRAALDPQPTLSDLEVAIAESNALGIRTEVVVTGERRDLAPGIELAAFRIMQEALTNVRKHAGMGAEAVVRIDYGPSKLTIEVVDDGAGAVSSLASTGTGNGLIGVRERVEIYGGTITAGPRPGGGYGLRATLPLTESAGSDPVASVAPGRSGPVA